MRDEWVRTRTKIGNHKAIKHRYTKELALCGRYGEIWPYSENTYMAVLTSKSSQKNANELLSLCSRVSNKHETLVKFNADKLDAMTEVIKVYKTWSAQIKSANSF